MTTPSTYDDAEDKTLPVVVYVLYLLGPLNGLTVLVGLIIAYVNKDKAGPRMASHYIFQIRTFWTAIAWAVIASVLCFWGAILTVVLVGIPFLILGWLIFAVLGVWYVLRCALGLVYVSRDDAYPRPRSWIV